MLVFFLFCAHVYISIKDFDMNMTHFKLIVCCLCIILSQRNIQNTKLQNHWNWIFTCITEPQALSPKYMPIEYFILSSCTTCRWRCDTAVQHYYTLWIQTPKGLAFCRHGRKHIKLPKHVYVGLMFLPSPPLLCSLWTSRGPTTALEPLLFPSYTFLGDLTYSCDFNTISLLVTHHYRSHLDLCAELHAWRDPTAPSMPPGVKLAPQSLFFWYFSK